MKKVLAAIVSTMAIVALCITMAACSTSFTGTWKFSKMTMSYGGEEIVVKAGEEYMGVKITEDYAVITINEDNTFTMSGMMGASAEGEWKEEDGKYYLVVEGEEVEVTLSGTTLIFDMDGIKIELKK